MAILLPFLVMAVGYSIGEYLPLQYRMAMASGYRQYGAIALYGLFYIAGWAGLEYLAYSLPCVFGKGVMCVTFSGFDAFVKQEAMFISVTGVAFSLVLTFAGNKRFDEKRKNALAAKVIRKHGNELDILLVDSTQLSLPVLFTLDSGKLSLGWVVGTPNPLDEKGQQYIRILPLKNGYQDAEYKPVFNTDYGAIYEIPNDPNETKGFEQVIPRQSIKSASIFDSDFYKGYF